MRLERSKSKLFFNFECRREENLRCLLASMLGWALTLNSTCFRVMKSRYKSFYLSVVFKKSHPSAIRECNALWEFLFRVTAPGSLWDFRRLPANFDQLGLCFLWLLRRILPINQSCLKCNTSQWWRSSLSPALSVYNLPTISLYF